MSERTKPTVEEGIIHRSTAGAVDFIVYEPGNGFRYTVVITYLDEVTRADYYLGYVGPVAMVVLPTYPKTRPMFMPLGEREGFHPDEVEEKLNISGHHAQALVGLLAHVFRGRA